MSSAPEARGWAMREGCAVWSAARARAHDNIALRLACEGGHLEVVKWLVEDCALAFEDVRDEGDYAAVEGACCGGAHEHVEMVRWLAEKFGLGPEAIDVGEYRPLFEPSASGHTEMLECFATYLGVGIEYFRRYDGLALWFACTHGRLDTAKWIVSFTDLSAKEIRSCGGYGDLLLVRHVCEYGRLPMAKWLAEVCGPSREELLRLIDGATLRGIARERPEMYEWMVATFGPLG